MTPISPGWVGRLALLLTALLAGAYLVTETLACPWAIRGSSMEPGLQAGDRVIVDLWTYRQRRPRRGEIVLFAAPQPLAATLVKRVAAPPGSTRADPRPDRWGEGDSGRIWLVGDNREASIDSRQFGPISRERLVGRVVFRYWPLSRAGRVR